MEYGTGGLMAQAEGEERRGEAVLLQTSVVVGGRKWEEVGVAAATGDENRWANAQVE